MLEKFKIRVVREGDLVVVRYELGEIVGECVYREYKKGGKFPQVIQQLMDVNMNDVLEYLHKEGKIVGEEDLGRVSKEIQDHSRKIIGTL
jgi:hypothetical protein